MTSFTVDLLEGVAALLAAAGVGTWRANGAYTAAETGIVIGSVPQAPDRVIVLDSYTVSDDPVGADSTVAIQVRTRTAGRDPRTTSSLDDAVFDVLHGRPAGTIGGYRVTQVWRQSGTTIGPDSNGRHERTSNYYATLGRVTEHRR